MAKLDEMEWKRNHVVLSEDGADKDAAAAVEDREDADREIVGGDGNAEGKGNEKEAAPPAGLNGGGDMESNEGLDDNKKEIVGANADADENDVKAGDDVADGKLV